SSLFDPRRRRDRTPPARAAPGCSPSRCPQGRHIRPPPSPEGPTRKRRTAKPLTARGGRCGTLEGQRAEKKHRPKADSAWRGTRPSVVATDAAGELQRATGAAGAAPV